MTATAETAERRRPGTADRILDIAEQLVQTRGFNGFSYADIARELDVTKASLHYHFPSKTDLGVALVDRYRLRFAALLEGIAAASGARQARLAGYVELYASVLDGRRMCLCGMLAAEIDTLPERMRERVRLFFKENEEWLVTVLDPPAEPDRSPAEDAALLLGGLQGAMLLARSSNDPRRFHQAAAALLRTVGGPSA